VISINIHATLYGGSKLPAKYVLNLDAVTTQLSLERVYCPTKDDVIVTKENLVYQQTHKAIKDRGHIIDFFQIIDVIFLTGSTQEAINNSLH